MRGTIVRLTFVLIALFTGLELHAQDHVNVELIGKVGTSWDNAHDVATGGNYAYLATGFSGIQVIDITDPENLENIGSFEENNGEARAVFLRDDYVYAAFGESGLLIIDVSDPTDPREVGAFNTPGNACGVFISGDIAYVADHTGGLRLISISDPENPGEVSSFDTPGTATDVFILNDYACLADGEGGLRIIDVSDPENPCEASAVVTPGFASGVFVSGRNVYLSEIRLYIPKMGYRGGGLHVIDISDPENPEETGYCDTPRWGCDVFVSDDHAYVAGGNDGLRVIDISDHENPVEMGISIPDGPARGVFIADGFAHVAASGLFVIDVSNPQELNEMGSFCIEGSSLDVYPAGDYAYVANGPGGFLVLDCSDPAVPLRISSLETEETARSVFVMDEIACLAAGRSLRIIDISDPVSPAEVGVSNFFRETSDLFVADEHAFVAVGSGLRVIDVTDSENPDQVGWYGRSCQSVHVAGDYAYVAGMRWRFINEEEEVCDVNLSVLNVSDPSNPRRVGFRDFGYEYWEWEEAHSMDVFVQDGYAYLVHLHDAHPRADDFFVIDISDRSHPEVVGQCRGGGCAVSVSGDSAFVATLDEGLRVIDVSDPENPVTVGHFDTPGTALGISASEGLIYVAEDNSVGIYQPVDGGYLGASEEELEFGMVSLGHTGELILSIYNAGNEELTVNEIVIDSDHFRSDFHEDVLLEADDSYELTVTFAPALDGGISGTLSIYSDPEVNELSVNLSGQGLNGVQFDTPGSARDVFVSGDHAFVADDYCGLHVIDVSDPVSPNVIGTYDTPGWAQGVFLQGHYVYVADGTNLLVIDVLDPENPEEVSRFDTPGHAQSVFVSGDFAYVADGRCGLCVLDISDPGNLEEVGVHDTPEDAKDIYVSGEFAYLATFDSGLRIIDISSPDNPVEVGVCNEVYAYSVSVLNEYAYVAESHGGGLSVIDVSDPEHPVVVGINNAPGNAYGVFVSGDYAYVASGNGRRIYVIDITDPENPQTIESLWTPSEGFYARPQGVFICGFHAYVANGSGGICILNISDYVAGCCSLGEGWNLMSINVIPPEEMWIRNEGPDIIRMTEQIRIDEENHHIVLMKNEDGQFYSPPFGFNDIPFWDLAEGYWLKMDEDVQTVWAGEPVPADADVPVEEGWNIVAYYPTYELDASAPDYYVLSSIIDHVIIAKDVEGNFMVPEFNHSNMEPWRQNQGYQVKVDQDVVLNYPAEQEVIAAIVENTDSSRIPAQDHWVTPVPKCENMSVLVTSITNCEIETGDQIAVFSPEGDVVGVGRVETDGRCGMAVWGDDLSTDAFRGLKTGENFSLKLWDSSKGLELTLLPTRFIKGSGLVYQRDGFVALEVAAKSSIPREYYLSQNYPNPFNSTTSLSFGVPEASRVSVSIYDITGRLVTVLVNRNLVAGHHVVTWDAASASTGVYLVRMKAGNFSNVRKAILVK